jgi:hypothetical protein
MKLERRTILAGALALPWLAPLRALAGTDAAPLIVLLEENPWLMAIGSDSPSFALYGDGTVIYRTEAGYRSAVLAPITMARLVTGLDTVALSCLAGHYPASDATDQPTVHLFLFDGEAPAHLSFYGSPKSLAARALVPAKFVAAIDRLRGFSAPDARDWVPDAVEVMVWDYSHSRDASIVWPARWPGLDHPTTVKRRDAYSLYVPGTDYEALLAFLRTRKQRGAVKIGGKKWSASLRFPFPHEKSWMPAGLVEPGKRCATKE